MDKDAYRSRVNDLAGLDLTESETDDLIDEGRRKLLCESDYRRATEDIGPTVASTELYAAPTSVHRFLRVSLDGNPCVRIDEESIEMFKTDSQSAYVLPSGSAFYYLTQDEDAVLSIGIYPVPSAAGQTINATYVKIPDPLPDTGEDPDVPLLYQPYVVNYVASQGYGFQDDADDLHAYHTGLFDRGVEEMRRLRNSMAGRGPVLGRILGVHVNG